MANNKSIQFLRGDTASIAACNDVSLAGQPVFNTETKELLIGDGSTQIKNLDGIKVEALTRPFEVGDVGASNLTNKYFKFASASVTEWQGSAIRVEFLDANRANLPQDPCGVDLELYTSSTAPAAVYCKLLYGKPDILNYIYAVTTATDNGANASVELYYLNVANYAAIHVKPLFQYQRTLSQVWTFYTDNKYQDSLPSGKTATKLSDIYSTTTVGRPLYVAKSMQAKTPTVDTDMTLDGGVSPDGCAVGDQVAFHCTMDNKLYNCYSTVKSVSGTVPTVHIDNVETLLSSGTGLSLSSNTISLTTPVSIANGGTGMTGAPSLQVNLASTSAANILTASPRPGVTGILPVDHGGTGVTSLKTLKAVDDIGYDVTADRAKPVTMEGISFWNGAYQDTNSNLRYCNGGEIVGTKNIQTVSGVKTFTGDNKVKTTRFAANAGAGQYKYFDFLDKNNKRLGVVGAATAANSYYGTYMQAGNEGSLGIFSNGSSVYTTAPTPPADSNDTSSSNTGWVRQQYLHEIFFTVSATKTTWNKDNDTSLETVDLRCLLLLRSYRSTAFTDIADLWGESNGTMYFQVLAEPDNVTDACWCTAVFRRQPRFGEPHYSYRILSPVHTVGLGRSKYSAIQSYTTSVLPVFESYTPYTWTMPWQ